MLYPAFTTKIAERLPAYRRFDHYLIAVFENFVNYLFLEELFLQPFIRKLGESIDAKSTLKI